MTLETESSGSDSEVRPEPSEGPDARNVTQLEMLRYIALLLEAVVRYKSGPSPIIEARATIWKRGEVIGT